MNSIKKVTIFLVLLVISLSLYGCGLESSSNFQDGGQDDATVDKRESINGTYKFSDQTVKIEMNINGNEWIGKIRLVSGFGADYDNENAEYDHGMVSGTDIYDSSGYVKIGYVTGSSLVTTFHGQEVTLSKR
jgi:uncharacterized lipoprotein YehR (DUF1307 family)